VFPLFRPPLHITEMNLIGHFVSIYVITFHYVFSETCTRRNTSVLNGETSRPEVDKIEEMQIRYFNCSLLYKPVVTLASQRGGPGFEPGSGHLGFCGGQSDAGAGFLRVLRFSLPIFIPPIAPKTILIYHLGFVQ
jgi:hypothetical protein